METIRMNVHSQEYMETMARLMSEALIWVHLKHDEHGEYTVLTVSRCPMCGHHCPSLSTNR